MAGVNGGDIGRAIKSQYLLAGEAFGDTILRTNEEETCFAVAMKRVGGQKMKKAARL